MRALIRFGKRDRLRFISHLDLQRFFQRALNRTGLPIAFSQGFNPHPVMSFASALAVGWTSEYEVLDVKLAREVDASLVEEMMRIALPEDLPVLEVRLVDDRHPAMMALVTHADYRIALADDGASEILAAIPEFLSRDSVPGVRKTKSGEREIDIRPLCAELKAGNGWLDARLKLTERDTLKPDVLIAGLAAIAGATAPSARVHRLCLLGDGESGAATPIMELSFKR
ncbi:MAG: DUF2344 domain-containing protein [Clostridiales bacterium]|nr:DUF2344 domain-containing protein [Clostridiales bacterium]OPZ67412.1 MAG: hypothetical protein BWY81_01318 [Firmicutes bacterium ADurb.Bin467]